MILAGDFKPGTKLVYNSEPYAVVDVVFVKPGKGGAFARTKMKNLITGLTREVTFRTEEKLEPARLDYKDAQFSYEQDGIYYFMDQESFEELAISKAQLTDVIHFIRDQEIYNILYWGEKILGVTPPIHMIMQVIDTPPGVRGDTAQGSATKQAKMDTGLVVNVPLFVEIDDKIKIDTRTNEYIERIKK